MRTYASGVVFGPVETFLSAKSVIVWASPDL